MYGVPQKKSACSGNMSLFTICVCYKAFMLRDWHTKPNLEELQMYCKSHYLSYVTEVGIYKALP